MEKGVSIVWHCMKEPGRNIMKGIMWRRQYSYQDLITPHWNQYSSAGANRDITKSLVDAYLCTDSQPIAVSRIYFYENKQWELYDMKKDSNELSSVYGNPTYKIIQYLLTNELWK